MEIIKTTNYEFRTDYKEVLEFKKNGCEWENLQGVIPNYALQLLYKCIRSENIINNMINAVNTMAEIIQNED